MSNRNYNANNVPSFGSPLASETIRVEFADIAVGFAGVEAELDLKADLSGTQTMVNKTIDLASNTLAGTLNQFNTACSDADFASLAGAETLSNKVVSLAPSTAAAPGVISTTSAGTGLFLPSSGDPVGVSVAGAVVCSMNATQTYFAGNVQIGTTTPTGWKLSVYGSIDNQLGVNIRNASTGSSASAKLFLSCGAASFYITQTPDTVATTTRFLATVGYFLFAPDNANLVIMNTYGFGYSVGTGGAVTQATSKATGVTLGKVCGKITTHNASLASGAVVSFVLTNNKILAAYTTVLVSQASGGTLGAYVITVDRVEDGACTISIRNMTAGALSESIVINFTLVQSVPS